jgi:hypothetical protein
VSRYKGNRGQCTSHSGGSEKGWRILAENESRDDRKSRWKNIMGMSLVISERTAHKELTGKST